MEKEIGVGVVNVVVLITLLLTPFMILFKTVSIWNVKWCGY